MSSDSDIEESVAKTREGFLRHAAEEVREPVSLRSQASDAGSALNPPAAAPQPEAAAATPAGLHPFFRGLLDSLPEPGSEWAPAEREQWLETARNIFALIYTEAGPQRASAAAPEPIQMADVQRQAQQQQQPAPAEQQHEERSA